MRLHLTITFLACMAFGAGSALAACDEAKLKEGFAFCWQQAEGDADADCEITSTGAVHCDMGRPPHSWYGPAMTKALNDKDAKALAGIYTICEAYSDFAITKLDQCASDDAAILKAARSVMACLPPTKGGKALATGATPDWAEAKAIGAAVCE